MAVAPSDPAIANVPEMIVVAMSAMNCSYIGSNDCAESFGVWASGMIRV